MVHYSVFECELQYEFSELIFYFSVYLKILHN